MRTPMLCILFLLPIAAPAAAREARESEIPEDADFVLPLDERGRIEVHVVWSRADRSCTARLAYQLAGVASRRFIPEAEDVIDAIAPILEPWGPRSCSVLLPADPEPDGESSRGALEYVEFRREGSRWEREEEGESFVIACGF